MTNEENQIPVAYAHIAQVLHFFGLSEPIKTETDPLTMQARDLIAKGIALFNKELPHGIIHSDLHEDNAMILQNDPTRVVTIMDF